MSETISLQDAIANLNPSNDEHWTKSGLPDLDTLRTMTGNGDLSRGDVDAVVPSGFNRSNAHAAPTPGGTGAAGEDDMGSQASANLEGPPGTGQGGVDLSATAFAVGELLSSAFEDDGEFNAIILMEAAVAAAQSDRFRSNSVLMGLTRGYQASQDQIREVQDRIDVRRDRRTKRKS